MPLHYVIYGAGGIGGTIGGRLFQAGERVTLIARGAHKEALAKDGLTLVGPDGKHRLRVPTVGHPGELDLLNPDLFILLCMKSQHTEEAVRVLASQAGAELRVACVQNGVANERTVLRFFTHVYATIVNLPAMHLVPGEVVTHAAGVGGILDTGCYPYGVDDHVKEMTNALTRAGFSARPDGTVMRQKYAKLLMNLGNVVQAGIKEGEDTRLLARAMRDEALACYKAAGVDCASRDEVRARRVAGYRLDDIPGYERTAGSSWQSMARGTGDIETEFLNGEISLLGRLYDVATPINDAFVHLARQLIALNKGPGQFTVAQVLELAGA